MAITKSDLIRNFFVIGKITSVGCAFAGSMFSIYDERNPNVRQPQLISDYLWIFGFSAIAAAMGGFKAYKFQDIIVGSKSLHEEPHIRYREALAPRNWKSNLAELAYYAFTTTFTIVYNYFLITAIHATFDTFQNPKTSYPIVPISSWGLAILLLKSLLVDRVFASTNSDYGAMEEIKEGITGSKAAPLISLIVKPLTKAPLYKPALAWIKSVGVLSKAGTNYIGMLLSIPPHFLLALYNTSPIAFWTSIITSILVSIPLISVNVTKILYFEGKISENNLRRLKNKTNALAAYPLARGTVHTSSFLHKLLEWKPALKWPIHYGFYSQGIIRGGADLLPVILFTRDFFHRHNWSTNAQTAVLVPMAILVFLSSAVGTHNSEVTAAMKHYDRDFAYITTDNDDWRHYARPRF